MTKLRGKVVVITGASSGLGRAGALAFAREGAKLVLAARRKEALEKVAAECRSLGAEALVVPTDITDEPATLLLATRALAMTGRIDVWINNAGVTAFGALETLPFADHERVIETNVLGTMRCARAVLPVFKHQRSGCMINVSSVLGKVGQPFVPSYVVSKFAVRGLSDALRASLADEPDIHVCTLLPYAVDTPHFEAGANRTGLDPHAMPPMQSPEKVARAMVSLAKRPRRELHVPRYVVPGLALRQIFPKTVERALLHVVREWHFGHAPQRVTEGNLFVAREGGGHSHGRRPARASLPRVLAWSIAHFLRLAPRNLGDHTPLEPHASR